MKKPKNKLSEKKNIENRLNWEKETVCALKNFEIYMHEPNCVVFNRNTSSNNEPKRYIVYHCCRTISIFLQYFHRFSCFFFASPLHLDEVYLLLQWIPFL